MFRNVLLVLVILCGVVSGANNYEQLQKLVAVDHVYGNKFGKSVAISGDYAIVGAMQETKDANGADSLYMAGAAYIFKRGEGGWTQIKKLVASDRAENDYFGVSVSISADYAIVGADFNSTGSAYIFSKNEGGLDNWGEVKKIVSNVSFDDHFGCSVAIFGNTIIVGSYGSGYDNLSGWQGSNTGAASIFSKDQGGSDNWGLVKRIVPADREYGDQFGWSVSLSGNYAIVGAQRHSYDTNRTDYIYLAGAAYIFSKDQGGSDNWGQVKKIVASNRGTEYYFGYSVSISGDYVIVGAYKDPMNADGADSLFDAGAAYIFSKNHGGADNWGQEKKIVASDRDYNRKYDHFGSSVSISGDYAIVGAPDDNYGSANIFRKDQGGANQWGVVKRIVDADGRSYEKFGGSVSISGDYAIVGTALEAACLFGPQVAPTAQASAVTFSAVQTTQMAISWTNGNGTNRAVFVKQAASEAASPVDTMTYTASTTFRSGTQIGTSGWYCVYNGTGTSVTVTGLSAGTEYIAQVFEYNGSAGSEQYLSSTATGNPANQTTMSAEPNTQTTNIVFSNVSTTTLTASWTRGNGTAGVAVFINATLYGNAAPVDGSTYTADAAFSSGAQIGTSGWYCIYNGIETSVNVTGLTPGVTYRVMACEYSGTSTLTNYNANFGTGNPANQATLFVEPATQATNIIYSNIAQTTLTASWTRGDGASVAVFMASTSSGNAVPQDGTTYTANTVFSSGTQIGTSGWYCVYSGIGTSVNITGLTAGTTYRMMAVEFNGVGNVANYLTSTATGNPANQTNMSAEPGTQATSIVFSNVSTNTLTASWTRGNGIDGVAVFMKVASSGNAAPVDGSTYTADAAFSSGAQIGTSGWYCLYNGTGTSVNVTGLTPGTTYQVMACEYSGTSILTNYKVTTGTGNPANKATLFVEPAIQASNIVISNIAPTTLTASWTRGYGTNIAVFMAETSSGNAAPEDGTTYTANAAFSSGTQIGISGWYCIYSGNGTSANVTGLTAGSTYRVMACEYNGSSSSVNYISDTAVNNPVSATAIKAAQTITFNTLPAKAYGDAPFKLIATATSLLPVSFSSSDTTIARISGDSVYILKTGTVNVIATQEGNSSYNAANTVIRSLSVNKAAQIITFNTLPVKTNSDEPFVLSAMATSSLPVSFSSSDTTIARISSDSVYIIKTGNVNITASQAGNSNYNAAVNVVRVLTITNNKVSQTITFNLGYDSLKSTSSPKFKLRGKSSSGLALTYTSSNTAVATVSGDSVKIIGGGTATITASQYGNGSYIAASNVTQTLYVADYVFVPEFPTCGYGVPRGNGTPGLPPDKPVIVWEKSAGGGDTVHIQISDSTDFDSLIVDTIVSDTFLVIDSLDEDSTYHIRIAEYKVPGGDGPWSPAKEFTLDSLKTPQVIIFTLGNDSLVSATARSFKLSGQSNSGLVITYTSSNPSVATVSHDTVTITGIGQTTITASQAGNSVYHAAEDVAKTLTVIKSKIPQTITFNLGYDSLKAYSSPKFKLRGKSSSGLALTYVSSSTAVATITGDSVKITGAGTAIITASQEGNSNYASAANVTQTLFVNGVVALPVDFPECYMPPPGPRPDAGPFAPDKPIVIWENPVGGDTVHIQISNTSDFSELIIDTIVRDTVLQVDTLSKDSTYYIKIAVYKNPGGDGPWSPATEFTLDSLKAPQVISFTLGDKSLVSATANPFKLSGRSNSGLPVTYTSSNTSVAKVSHDTVTITGIGQTTITASQAGNSVYRAAEIVAQILTVVETVPVPVTSPEIPATAPVCDGKGNVPTDPPPVLTWIPVPGATSYHIQLSSSGMFNEPLVKDTVITGDSLSLAGLLDSTTYHWRIAAQNGSGTGPWDTLTFTTESPAPSEPPVVSGTTGVPDKAKDIGLPPTLTWEPSSGTTSYHVQVSVSGTFNAPFVKDTVIKGDSLTLAGLLNSTTYHWRIAAQNGNGTGPWDTLTFTTADPPPVAVPAVTTPFPKDITVGTTVHIDWDSVGQATRYIIELSTDSTFGTIVHRDTVTSLTSVQGILKGGTTYYWRVAGNNASGNGPWSGVQQFTTVTTDKPATNIISSVVKDGVVLVNGMLSVKSGTASDFDGTVITVAEKSLTPVNGITAVSNVFDFSTSSKTAFDSTLVINVKVPSVLATDSSALSTEQQKKVRPFMIDSTGALLAIYDAVYDSVDNSWNIPSKYLGTLVMAIDVLAPSIIDSTSHQPKGSGTSPVITGRVVDNISNCRGYVYFRKGGAYGYDSLPVTINEKGTFTLSIDNFKLDLNGFEYFITVSDGSNGSIVKKDDIPVKVAAVADSTPLPTMQWRLFSVPVNLSASNIAGFFDQAGQYGKDWKLFRRSLTSVTDSFIEYGPNLSSLNTGYSYWIKSYKDKIGLTADSGVTTPVSRCYEMVIPAKSWAAVGNPYMFTVGWKNIVDSTGSASSTLIGPYTYEDSAWIPPSHIDKLTPWRGYYVYNSGDSTVTMRIPSLGYRAVPAVAKRKQNESAQTLEWIVSSNQGRDRNNYFGLAANTGNGYDATVDFPKAGAPQTGAPVTWFRRACFAKVAPRFQNDFTSLENGGAVWQSSVGNIREGRVYRCAIAGLSSLPDSLKCILVDKHSGSTYDMREGEYSFTPLAKETQREIEIVIGTQDYIAGHIKMLHLPPQKLAMKAAFMHNGIMTIRYEIPWSTQAVPVRLDLFDIRGRLVATLANEHKNCGYFTAQLDSRKASLASGMIIVRLKAGDRWLVTHSQILK